MVNEADYIKIKCIEAKQPIGTFYIGVMDWKDLCDIAWADIRRIIAEEEHEIETYFGIQRELNPKRVNEIANYVNHIDATFPSSIILSIKSSEEDEKNLEVMYDNIIFKPDESVMWIRRDDKIAHIIDGQHRVMGLRRGFGKNPKAPKFQFNLTIFVDMDLDDQSMVFATINKAQTKVNNSLVYDLYDFAKTKSPQRTAHNIVRLLNNEIGSPFKDKVNILGKADDPNKETITQATLVENILKYISKEPMKDRDILKRKDKLKPLTDQKEIQRLFFRNLFIEDKEEVIARIVWNYFAAVKKRWPLAWENSILCKSTGIIALMKFFKPVYLHFNSVGNIVKEAEFSTIFDKIDIRDENFNKEVYIPGGVGQSKLYKDLLNQSGLMVN